MSNSVLSSASNATINIFDTIANSANAVTKVVNGVGTYANMFERMADDMDKRHAIRSKLDNANYENDLLENYADQMSSRQDNLQKKMNENSNYAKLYIENYKKLEAILNPSNPE